MAVGLMHFIAFSAQLASLYLNIYTATCMLCTLHT